MIDTSTIIFNFLKINLETSVIHFTKRKEILIIIKTSHSNKFVLMKKKKKRKKNSSNYSFKIISPKLPQLLSLIMYPSCRESFYYFPWINDSIRETDVEARKTNRNDRIPDGSSFVSPLAIIFLSNYLVRYRFSICIFLHHNLIRNAQDRYTLPFFSE